MEFIHGRVQARALITQHAYNELWDWYGPVLKEIYEKTGHWRNIWERNMIYGFATRAAAEHLLRGHADGTFVISFSETLPGVLGIYHVHEGTPREYVMTAEEQHASFREFLLNAKQLQALLCPPSNEPAGGKSELITKAKLLREFRAPRNPKSAAGPANEPAGEPADDD